MGKTFALVMSDETGFGHAGNITPFTNYDYEQQAKNLTLKLQVIKGESSLPGSFEQITVNKLLLGQSRLTSASTAYRAKRAELAGTWPVCRFGSREVIYL